VGDLDSGFSRCGIANSYSIFDSGVYRIHAAEWLFPQEKAIFHAFLM
jgi:hypothetical protein